MPLIELTTLKPSAARENDPVITLTFDQRQRSRLRITLGDGREAGLFLPRGSQLHDGDRVISSEAESFTIRAAAESVSTVYCQDPLSLARASYHLGNRHVPLQISLDWVRYQHDHVLDDMLRGMGLEPQVEHAPFQPEPGAYHSHANGHGHAHDHHEHDPR